TLVPAPTHEARTYDTGSAAWGMSDYLRSTNMGRPNPLPSAYTAPAAFDAAAGLATWGAGRGEIAADGSATLAFEGTSVNFAKTGGGWLRLADIEAALDADGNGTVTAVVEYGTSTRSEEHTSELQSRENLVCRLLLEKKNNDRLHRRPHP